MCDALDIQPWRALRINDADYLLKSYFDASSYHILVSDLGCVWEEKLSNDEILQRSKELNPSIEAPLQVVIDRLSEDILSDDFNSFSIPSTKPLTLSIQTKLSTLAFKWEFRLGQASPDTTQVQLIGPLVSMVSELHSRLQEMREIILNKDKEIQDHKLQGSVVSRKYLETEPFSMELFEERMSELPSRLLPASVLNNPDVRRIYSNLFKPKARADSNEGDAKETELPVVNPLVVSSPKKTPLLSPSKEEEQARREELERKLEADKQKPKKKKRKLM